jgi:hypothetical protein
MSKILIADVVKEISLPQDPSFPAIEMSNIIRQQPQVIIVEQTGDSNGLAEYTEQDQFI